MARPEQSYSLLTRREVESLIARGQKIMIMDGYVLKVDAWMAYHPGGDKAILYIVGRDTTNKVNAYVPHAHSPRGPTSLQPCKLLLKPLALMANQKVMYDTVSIRPKPAR